MRTMPRKYWRLTVYSWGWDLKLPFGYWLTSSGADGGRTYISLDGTPNTGIFYFPLPWRRRWWKRGVR